MSGASRGIPFHCPYCGDESLRPSEEGHGAWECHACLRAFSLKMLGMIPRPVLGRAASEPDRVDDADDVEVSR
jgi:ribosomal protein L37AE/L43A